MIRRTVTDPTFWIGAGIGFFVGPLVAKHLRMQLARLRAASNGG
jgi:hypothetical protein